MDVRELLGAEHPLTVGAMAHIGDANLGIACLEAGLGFCMTMRRGMDDPTEWIHTQVGLFEEAGFRDRFGMNFLLAENRFLKEDLALIGEVKPRYVTISAAALPPTKYIQELHEQGIGCGVLYGNTGLMNLHFKRMGAVRPDFVVLEGKNSGGHNGPDSLEHLLSECLPLLSEEGIPAVAAGGVGTREDVVRLLKAGVELVQIGSLMAATKESPAHEEYKRRVVEGSETIVTGARFQHAVRTLPSTFARCLLAYEAAGQKERFMQEGSGSLVAGMLEGDWERGTFPIGTVVEQITEIRSVGDVAADLLGLEKAEEVA